MALKFVDKRGKIMLEAWDYTAPPRKILGGPRPPLEFHRKITLNEA